MSPSINFILLEMYGLHDPESFEYLMTGECSTVSTIDDVKWWAETCVRWSQIFA